MSAEKPMAAEKNSGIFSSNKRTSHLDGGRDSVGAVVTALTSQSWPLGNYVIILDI